MKLRWFVLGLALIAACKREAPPPSPPATARPPTQAGAATDAATRPASPVDAQRVIDPAKLPAALVGEQAFATKLFDALRTERGNLLFSPTSVRLALAMTAAGARGTTATELDTALGLPSDPARRADAYAGFTSLLGQLDSSRVSIANRVWPQAGKALLPAYTTTLAKAFGSTLQPLDFKKDPDAARGVINAWVSDRTARKIPELLAPPAVTTATRLVLTNAIYFKAQWRTPFEPTATADAPFTVASGARLEIPMMHDTAYFDYAETPAYQVVVLPYRDTSLAMRVLLPKRGHTLAEAEAAALTDIGPVLEMRRVALGFPRFRLSGHFSLAPTLSSLGIRAAFDPSAADFSGVDGTRELFISGVVHQAELVVDENGTEAAAATAIVALGGAAPPASKPVAFTADHPFVIVLRDEQTGTNVFVGRVADPSDGASPAPPPPPPPPPSPSPGPALACQTDADCPTRACGPCGHGDVVTTDDLRRACVVNPCPSAKATCRKGTCVIR